MRRQILRSGTAWRLRTGPRLYADIDTVVEERLTTGIDEFDRVLGGGVVPGIARLIGVTRHREVHAAAPGGAHFARTFGPVLYSSGEESEAPDQVARRAARHRARRRSKYWRETVSSAFSRRSRDSSPVHHRRLDPDRLFAGCSNRPPEASARFAKRPRNCSLREGQNIPTFLVGTSQGRQSRRSKALEHIVDTVLYFEVRRTSLASHRTRREEPVRGRERDRRSRDDQHGARAVPNPSKCSSPSAP